MTRKPIVAALVAFAALVLPGVAHSDDGEAEPITNLAASLVDAGDDLCLPIAEQYALLLNQFGGVDMPDTSTAAGGMMLRNLVIDHNIEVIEEFFGHNLTAADEATVTAYLEDECLASPTTAPTAAVATTLAPPTTLPLYDLSIPPTCEVGDVLQLGDEGDDVRCLQLRLDQITPTSDVAVDGVFGSDTDNQVRLFQSLNNMTVDGIVGEQTATLLNIWNPALAAPAVQPLVAQTDVYYENCDAVRAAGADPIRRGEPGYRAGLDRDGDGVGCE